jgi:hypothetical protein
LKPAGTPDPAVAAADRAIAAGDAEQLEDLLVAAVRGGLHAHLAGIQRERPPAADVDAGRRWVAAYVPFVHWAEGVHAAASVPGADSRPAAAAHDAPAHGHRHGAEQVTPTAASAPAGERARR